MDLESLIETLRKLNMELTDLEHTLATMAAEDTSDECRNDKVVTGVPNG